MSRIVAVVGDYYHPQEPIRRALLSALQPQLQDGSLQIDFCGEDELAGALRDNPDAVVLFKEDRLNPQDDEVNNWMTEETAAAVVRYVEAGGGWLAWHSGLASYPVEGAYVRMLRGYFEYHPERHSAVTYTRTGGGDERDSSFAFADEHYFVHCDRERTEVFLLSASKDGASVAGWKHESGRGRVCCLTPAHTEVGLNDPAALRLLAACIGWCRGE